VVRFKNLRGAKAGKAAPPITMAIGDDTILERLYAAEDLLQTQADALDTKAGILLAIITFLAEFVAQLHFSPVIFIVVVVCLSISGLLSALPLMILKYEAEDAAGLDTFRDLVVAKYAGQTEEAIEEKFKLGLMESSKDRLTSNGGFNQIKAKMIMASYISLLLALILSFAQMAIHPQNVH
jgi:hypothetical protein